LCNSKNGDIAWSNKNNSARVFVSFSEKDQKRVFSKTKKKRFKKQNTHVNCFF